MEYFDLFDHDFTPWFRNANQKSREYDCDMFCNLKYVTYYMWHCYIIVVICCSKIDIFVQKMIFCFKNRASLTSLLGSKSVKIFERISLVEKLWNDISRSFFRDKPILFTFALWVLADGFELNRMVDPLSLVNISLMYIGNDLHEFLYCPNKQFYLQPKLQFN